MPKHTTEVVRGLVGARTFKPTGWEQPLPTGSVGGNHKGTRTPPPPSRIWSSPHGGGVRREEELSPSPSGNKITPTTVVVETRWGAYIPNLFQE